MTSPVQPSFDTIPTGDPAAYVVWETKTVNHGTRARPERVEYYATSCKGHAFQVRELRHDLYAAAAGLPPPRVARTWELTADFHCTGDMEFMSCLFGARSKEEALALAERHIRGFLEERRRQYL